MSATPCADCAPLFYDAGHGEDVGAYLDAAREALDRALAEAGEILPEAAAFTLVNDWLWERRPPGALAPRRRPIPARLRARVLERDEHACVECGTTSGLQIDHIIPVAKGGPTDEDNLRALCGPCNTRKGCV